MLYKHIGHNTINKYKKKKKSSARFELAKKGSADPHIRPLCQLDKKNKEKKY